MQTASGDFHYTYGGLASVRLVGFALKPGTTPKERIGNLQDLHRTIAEALVRSPGPLVPKEVRFLRTELGLTCPQLAELIGASASETYLAENGTDKSLGMEEDIQLRRLVFTHLGVDIPSCTELCSYYQSRRLDTDLIRLEDDPVLGWKLAA